MRMQQLAKELLLSLPIDVHFAGFVSNTMKLAAEGWDLSINQGMGYSGDYELTLALRHGGRGEGLAAITHPVRIRGSELYRYTSSPLEYSKFFSEQRFFIAHMAPDIRFRIVPMMGRASFASSFSPFDAMPQERFEVEESIHDFKFFKHGPENKDLIVDPKSVPQLMELILRAQMPEQDAIRAREKSRRNFENYGGSFKPAHRVEAQILTLAV